MSCNLDCRERQESGRCEHQVLRSVEAELKSVTQNGSTTSSVTESLIDESLLVDPKLLFIGAKIGEGAHGKVFEGRSVIFLRVFFGRKFFYHLISCSFVNLV